MSEVVTKNDTVMYLSVGTTELKYRVCDCKEIILEEHESGLVKCIIKEHTGGLLIGESDVVKLEQLSELLTSCESMFEDTNRLTDIRGLKIPDSVTNCFGMFNRSGIESLDGVELSENTTNMCCMFRKTDITVIDGLQIPRSVTDMGCAFEESCVKEIKRLKLRRHIENCAEMFRFCDELEDASGLKMSKHIEEYSEMFSGCDNLDRDTLDCKGLDVAVLFDEEEDYDE